MSDLNPTKADLEADHGSLIAGALTTALDTQLLLIPGTASIPLLLPASISFLPASVHFLFGKRSPLTAHDFQRYKLTVRIHLIFTNCYPAERPYEHHMNVT